MSTEEEDKDGCERCREWREELRVWRERYEDQYRKTQSWVKWSFFLSCVLVLCSAILLAQSFSRLFS